MNANCAISSHWSLLQTFVQEYGIDEASNLAKQFSAASAQALRHAIYLTEAGPKPWIYKAAERIHLSPKEMYAMADAIGRTLKTPEAEKAATSAGGATATALGLSTLLKSSVGTAFSAAPLASTALVAGAGIVGASAGTLLDHAVGWIRDDGRSLSDMVSGANAGVPVADPTRHGHSSWRFIADEK